MSFQKKDESLDNLLASYRDGSLNLSPNFQRNYVWDRTQASRLIESVLMSIPLPAIYMHVCGFSDCKVSREVIDGKQRLTTLLNFIAGVCPWGTNQKFKLHSQYAELNKKTFKDLSPELATKLLQTSVRTIQMEQSLDQEMKYILFERINTGSVPLNAQEIRNCVSRGSLNDFLNNFSEEPLMDKVFLSTSSFNARMVRQEVLLGILVTINSPERKLVVTKTDLDRFMIAHRDASESEIRVMKQLLSDTLRKLVSVFGNGAFCVSKTSMDLRSLMVASRWLSENKDLVFKEGMSDRIRDAFAKAKNDSDFIKPGAKIKATCVFDYLDTVKVDGVKLDPKRAFSRDLAKKMYDESPDKRCGLCSSKILNFEDVEIDHVIPWAKGGLTIESNAQLSHAICNRKKGVSHVECQ